MSEEIDWGKPGPQTTRESFDSEPSLQTIVKAYYSDRIPDQDLAESAATEYMEGFKPAGDSTDEDEANAEPGGTMTDGQIDGMVAEVIQFHKRAKMCPSVPKQRLEAGMRRMVRSRMTTAGTDDEGMEDLMGDGSWFNTTGKHFADMFTTDVKGDEDRLAREANTP